MNKSDNLDKKMILGEKMEKMEKIGRTRRNKKKIEKLYKNSIF